MSAEQAPPGGVPMAVVSAAVEKHGIEQLEAIKLAEKFYADAEAFGIDSAGADQFVTRRFAQHFAKKNLRSSSEVDVEMVLVGVEFTDWGAGRAYREALKVFKNEDGSVNADKREAAVQAGYIDEDGRPLWRGKGPDRDGKPIDLSEQETYMLSGVARIDGAEDYVPVRVSVLKKNVEGEVPAPFTVVKFGAGKGKKPLANGGVMLYGNRGFSPSVKTVLGPEKAEQLIGTFFSDIVFSIDELADVVENYPPNPSASSFERFVMVKADVLDLNITREGISNTLTVMQPDNPDALALVWLPEHLPVDFNYMAQDVYVYGNVSWDGENDQAVINAAGVYVDQRFRVEADAESVQGAETVEQPVEAAPVEEAAEEPATKPAIPSVDNKGVEF